MPPRSPRSHHEPATPQKHSSQAIPDRTHERRLVPRITCNRSRRLDSDTLLEMEASRVRAMEALSSELFDYYAGEKYASSLLSPNSTTKKLVATECSSVREGARSHGSAIRPIKASRLSLEERLRSKATALVKAERFRLGRRLQAERDAERRAFEARKPAISEESCREARLEQTADLQKLEKELRILLARRELKDLKDAAYRQLLVGHGQEKERTLLGLRRSLNRGLWHSVGGLGDELSEKAREKRQSMEKRALEEGEAAFEQSCQALRQQYHRKTKLKMKAVAQEAAIAEESTMTELRVSEVKAMEEEINRLFDDLEREKYESEVELKRQLQKEASKTIAAAVDACTAVHKQAQLEEKRRASQALKHSLAAAEGIEAVCTRSALERERRIQDNRKSSLVSAVEEALRECSLRTLTKHWRCISSTTSPRPEFECPTFSRETVKGAEIGLENVALAREHSGASPMKAIEIVRELEETVIAVEQEYSKRTRRVVRLQAAVTPRRRDRETGSSGVGGILMAFRRGNGAVSDGNRQGRGTSSGSGEGEMVYCGGCAELLEANEKLLEVARSRGFQA